MSTLAKTTQQPVAGNSDFHLDQTGVMAVVSCLDGSQLEGLIIGYDDEHRTVGVEREAGERRAVALADVRTIEVKRACLLPPKFSEKAEPRDEQAHEMATLRFKDGAEYKIECVSSLAGRIGLHLYHFRNDHLTETFVPYAALERYDIAALGPLLEASNAAKQQAENWPQAVKNAAELRLHLRGHTHRATDPLGQILVKHNVITREALEAALVALSAAEGKRLGEMLVELDSTTASDIHRALAEKFGLPFVALHDYEIDPGVLTDVPAEVARKYRFMPLAFDGSHLVVAIDDPSDVERINLLRFVLGRNVDVAVATAEDILWAIGHHYGDAEGEALAQAYIEQDKTEALDELIVHDPDELGKQAPLVRLVDNTIMEAISRGASDIHVVPCDKTCELFYRVDGVLQKIRTFRQALLPAVVSRLKILGRMDISEHRLPQDGQTRVMYEGKPVDLRLSVIPTVTGESVVIRILSTQVGKLDLSSLGLDAQDNRVVKDMLRKIHGMFLVTGPTGSGKSTTLYAALKEVRCETSNVITVEDPVEYRIDGVRQIQVKKDIEYTFARALRHILRHDPDVVMIGEMRDAETAQIAIESALTGHLVLSTLHTNSAASTVVRLIEMGIEPYLIASTVTGVLGQRLIRCNCPQCLAEENVDDELRHALGVAAHEKFYKGAGCEACNGTGYKGRMMAYELLVMTPELRTLVRPGVTADELQAAAVQAGMTPFALNALAAARARRTSLAEVFRLQLD